MSLNYHELTMHEPRDSPAKRKQFLVICSVMASVFVYTAMTSGAFQPIRSATTQGVFPGGNFCYKYSQRDYAASMGLGRSITEDWIEDLKNNKPAEPAQKATTVAAGDSNSTEKVTLPGDDVIEDKAIKELEDKMEEKLYHIYLDDPYDVAGMNHRWMTGVLVSDADKAEFCDPLLEKNPAIERAAYKQRHLEYEDKKAKEAFDTTVYELVDLPSVDSLVLQFPFTNGFVSALIFSYKVLPVLRKMGVEQGEEGNAPIVISHCSKEQEMCTHFVPLVQGKDFLVGRPTSEEHLKSLGVQPWIVSYEQVKDNTRKNFPLLRSVMDMLP
mmetsp:Transcript_12868/g.31251  ORF Transcript_12868/g.31251 Transcript_12868/m.31251 type:complete len:327 (+) Transcript_12868:292-1272(+)